MTYHDGYEEYVLNEIPLTNRDFLYTYGENTLKDDIKRIKNYWELLFDCGNSSVLKEKPRFLD
jgi:hypothetical protein